jgi:hypothetical protein
VLTDEVPRDVNDASDSSHQSQREKNLQDKRHRKNQAESLVLPLKLFIEVDHRFISSLVYLSRSHGPGRLVTTLHAGWLFTI